MIKNSLVADFLSVYTNFDVLFKSASCCWHAFDVATIKDVVNDKKFTETIISYAPRLFFKDTAPLQAPLRRLLVESTRDWMTNVLSLFRRHVLFERVSVGAYEKPIRDYLEALVCMIEPDRYNVSFKKNVDTLAKLAGITMFETAEFIRNKGSP